MVCVATWEKERGKKRKGKGEERESGEGYVLYQPGSLTQMEFYWLENAFVHMLCLWVRGEEKLGQFTAK